MKVYVETTLGQVRSGVAARAESFALVGHGLDEEAALEVLRRVVTAWCLGLQRVGGLQEALKRRRLRVENTEDDTVLVELVTMSAV